MGDRGNIIVNETGNGPVVLYSHWGGTELPHALARGLIAGEGRHTDAPYLTRIIFDEMTERQGGSTGFGISTIICDNEHDFLLVDIDTQTVKVFSSRADLTDMVDGSAFPITETPFGEFVAAYRVETTAHNR